MFPFYSFILNTWLGDSFENEILILTKIFSLIAILSSTSHILITRFEAEQLSKANFNLEIIFLPIFFTILIIVFLNYSSLIFISLTILIKELVLNIVRILYLNKKLNNTKIYLINILFHHLLLIFSFLNLEVFIILLTILIYINIKNVFLIRKISTFLSILFVNEMNDIINRDKNLQNNIKKLKKKYKDLKITHVNFNNKIYNFIKAGKINNFLRVSFIQKMFFVHNRLFIFFELNELKKGWNFYRKLLVEDNVGNPVRYFLYPKSSGNRINHVYHLSS